MKYFLIALLILGSVLIVLFIVFLIIIYVEFLNTFTHRKYSLKKNLEFPKGTKYEKFSSEIEKFHKLYETLDKEEIVIQAKDGVKLVSEYIPNTYKKKIIIFFHGYLSMPKNDFGSYVEYYKKGYSALLVNHRCHYKSEGKFITFGAMERYDALYWAREMVKRFGDDVELVLAGISLGGATVMMASDLGLPHQVKGIISDCGFVSCKQIVKSVIKSWKIPFATFITWVMGIYCKVFGHFSMTEGDSSKALANSNIPILIIHGRYDDFVPYECSEICYKNCKQEIKEFYSNDAITHGTSFFYDKEEYLNRVYSFLDKIGFNDK